MTDDRTDDRTPDDPMARPKTEAPSNAEKPVEQWTTGDEEMTGAQASYLKTLCEECGEEYDPALTKAEASKRIDALQDRSRRV